MSIYKSNASSSAANLLNFMPVFKQGIFSNIDEDQSEIENQQAAARKKLHQQTYQATLNSVKNLTQPTIPKPVLESSQAKDYQTIGPEQAQTHLYSPISSYTSYHS